MTPTHARAPRGVRAVGVVPKGRWRNVTLLAALSPTRIGPSVLIEGAVDRAVFDAFVAEQVVPARRPGQTVILDNLSVHKSATAKRLIEAAGCALRFLPTDSPDLNPIEQAFAAITQRLRRAAARTFDALCAAAGAALNAVTAAHAVGFSRAAGSPLGVGLPL